MASRLEEDLCCPVCQDIFKDPVVLSCSHSFCKECLKNCWTVGDERPCPFCRKQSSTDDPPCNRALKNLCETFLQQREQRASEDLCSLHSEKLRLFCLDHQQPVCVVCRDSEKHAEHRFRPIDEAAQQHKKKLQETLEPLKKKLEVRKKVQEDKRSEERKKLKFELGITYAEAAKRIPSQSEKSNQQFSTWQIQNICVPKLKKIH
uniref:Uncharacterized protein n=1 Tax=Cyprinodon variegatus TaxID=28743 RepID=A0A3Q2G4D6_CYPVA